MVDHSLHHSRFFFFFFSNTHTYTRVHEISLDEGMLTVMKKFLNEVYLTKTFKCIK